MHLSIVTIVTLAVTSVTIAPSVPRFAVAAVSPLEPSQTEAESNPGMSDDQSNDQQAGAPGPLAPRPQVKEKVKSGNPLWAVPLKQLSATRDRPIFSPSRRPPPARAVPVAPPPLKPAVAVHRPERPKLSLVGTIVGKDAAIGIFFDSTTRKAVLLKLGQSHNGWTLKSVNEKAVTLKRFKQSVVIAMRKHDNSHGSHSGAPPASRPPRSGAPPASASAASAPRRPAPGVDTGGGQQVFGRSPFAARPVSEPVNPFGTTPLFERTNQR
jgi:general secretion pathway protein N